MAILDQLANMAKNMLISEGQTVQIFFVQQGVDAYDPDSSTNPSSAPIVVTTKASLLDYALENLGRSVYRDTLIERDDKEGYILPSASFPRHPSSTGDYVIDMDGTKWRIITVKRNAPSGVTDIVYNCQLRR